MKVGFVAFAIGLLSTCVFAETPRTWAFEPGHDEYSDAARLDLSHLNERVAGETGFVKRSEDGASFLRGDGKPIRFWAVNTSVAHKGRQALRDHARFLAKRGVNMVRFHGQIPQTAETAGLIEAIDEAERARLWQLVAAMKQEGIYVTFSPYYPHAVRKEATERWKVPADSEGLTGLIYFDPVLQAAYKSWLRQTLLPVNPYTGLALKDDPALAIIQMQNEDSLLFWTFNAIRGREARLLGARFGEFLIEKYGSAGRARAAWNGAAAPGPIDGMRDDWENGIIALSNIWHLTKSFEPGRAEMRLSDQAEFLTMAMRDWHAEIARFLREDIGAPQLFNAGNWRTADDVLLDDLERYAYTAGDIIGVNRYVSALHEGTYNGWAIVEGDRFQEEGLLRRPLDLPVTLRQPLGHPYIISETLWVPPMWQQSEGPVLMAAYQALTGVDISFWFRTNEVQWRAPQSANGYLPSIGKWVLGSPQQIGAFPAAALIFRLGLIDEAEPVIIEQRALPALWSRTEPVVAARQGYDTNRDILPNALRSVFARKPKTARASPYSFLVGPVQIGFNSDGPNFVHPELDALIDTKRRVVTSLTRQLAWDWGAGVVTLNAPRAQGVVGALSSRPIFKLRDLTIESTAPYASVIVVPLDERPIADATRLLVQIGTISRPTGWRARQVEHDGAPAQEVVAFGEAPWQIDKIDARLTLRNRQLSRARVLDANGMSMVSLPVLRSDGTLSVKLPADALYVLLD